MVLHYISLALIEFDPSIRPNAPNAIVATLCQSNLGWSLVELTFSPNVRYYRYKRLYLSAQQAQERLRAGSWDRFMIVPSGKTEVSSAGFIHPGAREASLQNLTRRNSAALTFVASARVSSIKLKDPRSGTVSGADKFSRTRARAVCSASLLDDNGPDTANLIESFRKPVLRNVKSINPVESH